MTLQVLLRVLKKTAVLNNLFTFRESEKSLKKTPIGLFYAMNRFYEPEKGGVHSQIGGLSMFCLMSPMKFKLVSFMFRESKRKWNKTPKGPFSYDLVPRA